jgi:hypothetical protein
VQLPRWFRVERNNSVAIDGITLVSSIDPTTARAGKLTPDEDDKMKDSVQMHGGKD